MQGLYWRSSEAVTEPMMGVSLLLRKTIVNENSELTIWDFSFGKSWRNANWPGIYAKYIFLKVWTWHFLFFAKMLDLARTRHSYLKYFFADFCLQSAQLLPKSNSWPAIWREAFFKCCSLGSALLEFKTKICQCNPTSRCVHVPLCYDRTKMEAWNCPCGGRSPITKVRWWSRRGVSQGEKSHFGNRLKHHFRHEALLTPPVQVKMEDWSGQWYSQAVLTLAWPIPAFLSLAAAYETCDT